MSENEDSTGPEVPAGFRQVELSREPVELFKVLKFEGIAGSGGEAKAAIDSGQVLVNGEVETQRRKKIVSGDTVELGDEKIFLKLSPLAKSNKAPLIPDTKPDTKPATKPPAKKKQAQRKALDVSSKSGKQSRRKQSDKRKAP